MRDRRKSKSADFHQKLSRMRHISRTLLEQFGSPTVLAQAFERADNDQPG
jgi:hypothetical protein